MENFVKILEFIKTINQLKFESRFRGARPDTDDDSELAPDKADNVAAHSWRTTVAVYLLAHELNIGLDKDKCIKMSLVHDLPEGLTRDIAFDKIINRPELLLQKERAEPIAMRKLVSILPPELGEEIFDLWLEYSENKTQEAKFVKIMDKLECAYHMIDMGVKNFKSPEAVARHSMKGYGWLPEMNPIINQVRAELKNEFIRFGIEWKAEWDL
ncbi:MAG: HD domain-containing protein [Alphaproteobacteria bacterium]|nr:HD domain-containing protein [Alphaproteobacteria bacterium]